MWMKLLQYAFPALAIITFLVWIENRGYNKGHDAAVKICNEVTLPAAKAAVQEQCNILTNATKEENNALSRDVNRLRATYDRLRKQKPTAACVPIAVTSTGDTRPDAATRDIAGMGVNTQWLDDAFYDAASDIARGQSCQRQLRLIYQLNNALP
jgi:hypothetical protein